MFGIFKNNTPAYRGTGQPASNGCGGLLGSILTRLFCGSTPSYKGTGQPSGSSCFGWSSQTTVYRTPSADPSPEPHEPKPEPEPGDPGGNGHEPSEPILLEEGQGIRVSTPVTIVVRRSPE